MKFPAFLIPTLFIIILCIAVFSAVIIAIYFQIYKHYINKVLKKGKVTSAMAPPYKVLIISTMIILFIGIITSLFTGYKIGYNRFEESIDHASALDIETYYAEVKAVGENTITVEGLSLNEEKYRGEFSYEIWGEVSITYKNESITLSELQKGDLVSVILVVKEGHIAGINDIWKITLIR